MICNKITEKRPKWFSFACRQIWQLISVTVQGVFQCSGWKQKHGPSAGKSLNLKSFAWEWL